MNVGVLEGKNRFSEIVEAAEHGQEVTITRRGEPVAKLVGLETAEQRIARGRAALAQMRVVSERIRARLGRDITWEEMKVMRDEGRP